MRRLLRVLGAGLVVGMVGVLAMSATVSAQQEVNEVCVNRITAEVRVGDCSRYEMELDIDANAPVTFYVHRVTGQAYYITGDSVSRWLMPVEVTGDGSVEFAVHRITGKLYYGVSSRYFMDVVI